MLRTQRYATLAAVLFALAWSPFAVRAQTVFAYSSAPGDYIGGGQTHAFTPADAYFSATASSEKDQINISINGNNQEYWSVNIAVPRGQTLAPGRHVDAERSAFRAGRSPGLDISGAGRGCNQVWGSFNIRQVLWNAGGGLVGFEADFLQYCESADSPPLAGIIRWKAPQMSITLDGPLLYQGAHKAYYGDTSTFFIYGDTSMLELYGSGRRADWSFNIQPPVGKQLKVGTYVTNSSPTATRAGLAINGLMSCWGSTGSLDIKRLTVLPDNTIKAIYATFVQRCAGVAGSMTGTIHHGL